MTILPALIVAPRYFAGEIDFGAITQASFAFSQVLNALSLVVSQFESLSAFIAGINRLADFEGAIASPVDDNLNKINTAVADQIALQQVTLQTPNYQNTLVRNLSLAVEPGRGLLVVGQSGSGKSSLLRALGWSCALSDRRYCFYPSYMILVSQLSYPSAGAEWQGALAVNAEC